MSAPRLSVVIRSYNRLAALCELVDLLLAQRHDSFEIVVVEQSTLRPTAASARLAELARDPRLRIVDVPPLGGARARNTGVAHARGDILVFIDDDDLPVGGTFLASIEASFDDPQCVAVTCRHEWAADEPVSRTYRFLARRLCMRFSPVLRIPHNSPRLDEPLPRVHYVHGSGGAYRRGIFDRFGGWDEDTPIEDETSLGIRMQRGLAADERVAFDPRARLRRRFDIPGGLAKRQLTPARYFLRFMQFVHRILGRYYPVRVRALYPLYILTAWRWTLAWLWDDSAAHDTFAKRLRASLVVTLQLPWLACRAVVEPFGRALRTDEMHVRVHVPHEHVPAEPRPHDQPGTRHGPTVT